MNEIKELMILERIINIRNPFEHEKDYYKLVKVGGFWSNNCIEYDSNSDRKKTLSFEKYSKKIRPYLEGIINNFKKSSIQKIQLAIAINFISFKDKDSKSYNEEIEINNIQIKS